MAFSLVTLSGQMCLVWFHGLDCFEMKAQATLQERAPLLKPFASLPRFRLLLKILAKRNMRNLEKEKAQAWFY